MPRHPLQPITVDGDGVAWFKENAIVRYLLDHGGIGLNQLAELSFSQEDREQFMQLIGYNVHGFHELSFVSDETALAASETATKLGATRVGCRTTDCPLHTGVTREDT